MCNLLRFGRLVYIPFSVFAKQRNFPTSFVQRELYHQTNSERVSKNIVKTNSLGIHCKKGEFIHKY